MYKKFLVVALVLAFALTAAPALVSLKKSLPFGLWGPPTAAPEPGKPVPRKGKVPGEGQGSQVMVRGSLPLLRTLCLPPHGEGLQYLKISYFTSLMVRPPSTRPISIPFALPETLMTTPLSFSTTTAPFFLTKVRPPLEASL